MFTPGKFECLNDLGPWHKRRMYRKMERNAVYLYNKYVDEERLKKRRKNRTNRALAPYYEERYLRNCFNRIKALGDAEHDGLNMSDSDTSLVTVINTQDNESASILRSGRERYKNITQRSKTKTKTKRSKSSSLPSKEYSLRSKSNSRRSKSVSSDSGAEIEKESRILYDHSSDNMSDNDDDDDDEFLSANEEETSQGRRSSQNVPSSATSPNQVLSNTTSPFVTPNKDIDELAPMLTPNIEQLRQLRSNLFRVNSDDDIAINRSISMVIEMESDFVEEISPPKPIRAARKHTVTSIATRNSNENIHDSMESLVIDDLFSNPEERFNDLLSESSITSSVRNSNNDIESPLLTSTPQIDSSEFVIINLNEVTNLHRNNENLNISNKPKVSSYSLRNKTTQSNRGYSLRNRKEIKIPNHLA